VGLRVDPQRVEVASAERSACEQLPWFVPDTQLAASRNVGLDAAEAEFERRLRRHRLQVVVVAVQVQ